MRPTPPFTILKLSTQARPCSVWLSLKRKTLIRNRTRVVSIPNHAEVKLTFQVFAKENCPVCKKAQGVLTRLGVDMAVRYVEGPKATPENVADFAWYDWADVMPLVVATEGERALKRWNGKDISDKEHAWMPEVQNWLASHTPAASDS